MHQHSGEETAPGRLARSQSNWHADSMDPQGNRAGSTPPWDSTAAGKGDSAAPRQRAQLDRTREGRVGKENRLQACSLKPNLRRLLVHRLEPKWQHSHMPFCHVVLVVDVHVFGSQIPKAPMRLFRLLIFMCTHSLP